MAFLEGININLSTLLNSSLALVLLSASYLEEEDEEEEEEEEEAASNSIKTHNHRWAVALVHWLQRYWARGRNHRLVNPAIKAKLINNRQP